MTDSGSSSLPAEGEGSPAGGDGGVPQEGEGAAEGEGEPAQEGEGQPGDSRCLEFGGFCEAACPPEAVTATNPALTCSDPGQHCCLPQNPAEGEGSEGEGTSVEGEGAEGEGTPTEGEGTPVEGEGAGEGEGIGEGEGVAGFCRRYADCAASETCNLSSGQCEPRAAVAGTRTKILGLYPTLAASDDILVISGEGFYAGLLGAFNTKVKISGHTFGTFDGLGVDENRIVLSLPAGASGAVTVSGDAGTATSTETISASLDPAQISPCTAQDPPAAGVAGAEAADPGPYAAGFVDSNALDRQTRVFYPAECGGLRKPPSAGAFPFVLILHGDGAVHVNYEFLGRHLASWGYLSAMPPAVEPGILRNVLGAGLTAPEQFWPPLAGLAAGGLGVIAGHSRGSDRTGFMFDDGEDRVAGVIFLGPVNSGQNIPTGGIVLGATGDRQAFPGQLPGQLDRMQSPKYLAIFQGGNHSQFTDEKHWEGSSLGDDVATMPRNRQFELTQSFALAYLQQIFGESERFPQWLSNPGLPAELTFEAR